MLDHAPVVVVDRLTGTEHELRDPRAIIGTHRHGAHRCPVCIAVIDACHDAALLVQLIRRFGPDATQPAACDFDLVG